MDASTKTKEALSVFNNPNIDVWNLSINFQVKWDANIKTEISDLVTGNDGALSGTLCVGISTSLLLAKFSDEQFFPDVLGLFANRPLAKSLTLCITPSLLNDTWNTSGNFCITISAIWRAFVMTLKSFDCSIPPIKLEIGCLFKTTPNSSGGAWYSTLRIAFTHLCLIAGPTDELNILYRAENIPHVYEEANSVSSRNTTSRSSLPATLASSVFETVVFVSLPLGHRWICLEVPVSSFVYKDRMHLLVWFIMVIEMSGVQFGLKSYAWFQNRTSAQRQFDLKS